MERLSRPIRVRLPQGDYTRLVAIADGRPLSTTVALIVAWFLEQPADVIQAHIPPAPQRGRPR